MLVLLSHFCRDTLESGDNIRLLRILRSGLLRNLGGLGNASLYARVHYGTKYLIEEYVSTVTRGIGVILESPDFPLKVQKIEIGTHPFAGEIRLLLGNKTSFWAISPAIVRWSWTWYVYQCGST